MKIEFIKPHKININYEVGAVVTVSESVANKLINDGIARKFVEPKKVAKKAKEDI